MKQHIGIIRYFQTAWPLLIMFIPGALFFILFKYTPMLGVVIAFKDYNFTDGILHSDWVGLTNFDFLFSNIQTLQIIKNTLFISVVGIIVGFPFPILLAVLLNEVRLKWFRGTVQTLIYLPHFLSWVIVGGMVITMFSINSGVINHALEWITGERFPFLYNGTSWLAVYFGSGIWKEAGFGAIIYLAALSSINPSLYEAASIDGAGQLRKIWHVSIPGISNIIILMLILSVGRVMEVGFDQIFILQNDVVSNKAEVISTYIFRTGISQGQYSITAAIGLFESLVGLILVLTANKIAKKYNHGLW
ncbi:ABC transporter permease subunit [Paenibacillus sp. PL2-23]|uniref:ABC transporter permease n=1 Tax=Paenibacillus sp. PL2-23 TaxID=2100729 RepID=UPI0030F7E473